MARVWVDGVEGAGIPGDDPGLTRGMNVFETLRTYGTAPFRLDAHLARLEASADVVGVPMPPLTELREEITSRCAKDVWIRITLTLGGHRVVAVDPIDQAKVGRPVEVASVEWEPAPWLPGSVKHGSRAAWVLASRAHNADEVIFVDRDGIVLEANRSNIFAVVDGRLYTPRAGGNILQGVTRGALLDAARNAGLKVVIGDIPIASSFNELYLSSTLKELAPAAHLNGHPIGGGPIGTALHEAFRALVKQECG